MLIKLGDNRVGSGRPWRRLPSHYLSLSLPKTEAVQQNQAKWTEWIEWVESDKLNELNQLDKIG